MVAQRQTGAAPAVRAVAEALPFGDGAFEAAMTVLSDHHWTDRTRGFAEMRRVASGAVLVYTWDLVAPMAFGLTRDYLPSFAKLEQGRFDPAGIARQLGNAHIEDVPVPRDCI